MGDTIKNSRRAYVFISALVSVLLFLLGLIYNAVRKMAQDPSPEPTPDPGGEPSPEPGADPGPEPDPTTPGTPTDPHQTPGGSGAPVEEPVEDPDPTTPGTPTDPHRTPGGSGAPVEEPAPDDGARIIVRRPEPTAYNPDAPAEEPTAPPDGTPGGGPDDLEIPSWAMEYLNVENVARGTAAAAVLTAFKQAGPLGVGRAAAGGAVITRDGPIGRHLPRYGEGEDVAEPQPGSVVYWVNQNTPFNVRLDNPDDSGGATGGDTGVADPSTPTTPDDPHRTSGGGGWDPNPDPDPPDDDEPDDPGDTISGRDGPYLRM